MSTRSAILSSSWRIHVQSSSNSNATDKRTYTAGIIFAYHSRGKAIKKILRDIYLRFFKSNRTSESHHDNDFTRENEFIRAGYERIRNFAVLFLGIYLLDAYGCQRLSILKGIPPSMWVTTTLRLCEANIPTLKRIMTQISVMYTRIRQHHKILDWLIAVGQTARPRWCSALGALVLRPEKKEPQRLWKWKLENILVVGNWSETRVHPLKKFSVKQHPRTSRPDTICSNG